MTPSTEALALAGAFVTASLWMIRTSFQQQRAFAERFIRHLESSLEALKSETAFTRKAICRLTGAVRRNSQLLRRLMEKEEDDGALGER